MNTQYDYDVVIIGSGMGGLTCGAILAKEECMYAWSKRVRCWAVVCNPSDGADG